MVEIAIVVGWVDKRKDGKKVSIWIFKSGWAFLVLGRRLDDFGGKHSRAVSCVAAAIELGLG